MMAMMAMVACGGTDPDTSPDGLAPVMDVQGAGATLHVRIVGELEAKKTVLLLHDGPGLASAYLEPVIGALVTAGTRVVIYDQRGMGSSSPASSFALGDYALDLEAVRDAVRAERIHIVAHGWGGLIAWAYLANQPSRVASLTMANAWAPYAQANATAFDRVTARVTFLQNSGVIANPLPADVGDDCGPSFKALLPAHLRDPAAPIAAELSETPCRRSVQQGTAAALAAGYDFVDAAIAYTGPSFVVFGKADPLGAELGEASVTVLPNSPGDYVVLPGTAHYPWYDSTAFVTQVAAFVASLP